jgi:Xaa-Pro aminopeptidase
VTAYCEQQDLHCPEQTVAEAVAFSAALRGGAGAAGAAALQRSVTDCLDLLDLGEQRERAVSSLSPGELLLLDAGVEGHSLYTADITRTFPVSGTYSATQRQVYEAVREAADAAFAVVKPGIVFKEVHAAAMAVVAQKVSEWGFLPVSLEESLADSGQHHRRYMVHGTSHHLGLDVHDCGQARKEFYKDGIVREGMVFTIEPGLYFQPDDLTVPEEFRGIGVRIEDNILVTATGAENMSIGIPRTADDVEAWLKRQR